jgi:hypothetical protein
VPELNFCVFKMGKMATQVMAWDYEDGLVLVCDAEDPHDEDTTEDAKLIPRIAIAEGEQARLRLFWQVLYFDTYVVFLRFTSLSLTAFSGASPACSNGSPSYRPRGISRERSLSLCLIIAKWSPGSSSHPTHRMCR